MLYVAYLISLPLELTETKHEFIVVNNFISTTSYCSKQQSSRLWEEEVAEYPSEMFIVIMIYVQDLND